MAVLLICICGSLVGLTACGSAAHMRVRCGGEMDSRFHVNGIMVPAWIGVLAAPERSSPGSILQRLLWIGRSPSVLAGRLGEELQEIGSELRSGAALFVLEEDVCLAPALGADLRRPVGKRLLVVVLTAQAQVTPFGRRPKGRRQVLVLGDAQSCPLVLERPEDFVVEPGLVAELESGSRRRWQEREEVRQARQVLLQVRRKLKEGGAQPVAQRRRDAE